MAGGTRAASVSIPRGGAGRVAERASVRWNRYPAGTASPSGRGDAVVACSTDGASSASSSAFLTDARRADAAVEDARKGRDAGVDDPLASMEAETADHWSAYPTNEDIDGDISMQIK